MDFALNEDQTTLIDGLSSLMARHLDGPKDGNVSASVHAHYSTALDRDLSESGFFGIAREEGFGPLEAVFLVEQAYRSPSAVEVAASAVIAPQLLGDDLPRPIAVARASELGRPIRFLPVAKTLIVDAGDEALVLSLDGVAVDATPGIYAYPTGSLRAKPDLAKARHLGPGSGAKLRLWWRIALAAEAGAAMIQALEFTTEYVKNRRAFGRPIGSFQALQHRLATDTQIAEGTRWLARRAAWSGTEVDAALAATYAQDGCGPVCMDCHQFNGALGMTLEHPLHFWTFRLRWLQGELGGLAAQAGALADARWPRSGRA
jgi:alkylation response protein AidB-like acyl-CoA dehydrogenase